MTPAEIKNFIKKISEIIERQPYPKDLAAWDTQEGWRISVGSNKHLTASQINLNHYQRGELHNGIIPAVVEMTADFEVTCVSFVNYHRHHRKGAPAVIVFKTPIPLNELGKYLSKKFIYDEKIQSVSFYMNGEYHNDNGPCFIEFMPDKTIEYYYIKGKQLSLEEFNKTKIRKEIKLRLKSL